MSQISQQQTPPQDHFTHYQAKNVSHTGLFKAYADVKIGFTTDGPVFRLGQDTFLFDTSGNRRSDDMWVDLIHTPNLREALVARQKEDTVDLSKMTLRAPFVSGQTVTGVGVVYERSLRWRQLEAIAGAGDLEEQAVDPRDNSLANPAFIEATKRGLKPADLAYRIVSDLRNHPECFLKATLISHIANLGDIKVRNDSPIKGADLEIRDLAEPEVSYLLDSDGRIVGLGLASDTTAATWEGISTIYLPETKTYPGSTSLTAFFTIPQPGTEKDNIDISMVIYRDGEEIFGPNTTDLEKDPYQSNTSEIYRPIDDFIDASMRMVMADAEEPDKNPTKGVIVSSGTGIIPGSGLGIKHGDKVIIRSDKLGLVMKADVKNVNWGGLKYEEPIKGVKLREK